MSLCMYQCRTICMPYACNPSLHIITYLHTCFPAGKNRQEAGSPKDPKGRTPCLGVLRIRVLHFSVFIDSVPDFLEVTVNSGIKSRCVGDYSCYGDNGDEDDDGADDHE